MSQGLDVIVIDDEPGVCEIISEIIKRFYIWGDVLSFTNEDAAISYCMGRDMGVAIFVVDVFLGKKSGFYFLDVIKEKFPTAHEDAIMITGQASDDVVNMCLASDISYLLEKPLRPYALQLAVRAMVTKYMKFAKRLMHDPDFAESVSRF